MLKIIQAVGEPHLHQLVEWAITVNTRQSSLSKPLADVV
jgi:hypothetical protein